MQAYLNDLSWEQTLFATVHRESAKRVPYRDIEAQPASKEERPLGLAWIQPGTPFLEVEVTDLGQVAVTMIWAEAEPPANSEALTAPLIAFLRRIDPA
jgi:hypothetical protein